MNSISTSLDDERWLAVTSRDKAYDGEFVYAVRSTGVYCRPSCPSRQALRENVAYFDTTHAAQAASYRSCLRCKPDHMPLAQQHNDCVLAACRALESSESGMSLDELASQSRLNPQYFHRIFKRATGLTPKGYFQAVRTKRMQGALSQGASVTHAILEAGYNNSSRFYEGGADQLGMPPSALRSGAANQIIWHTCEACDLGQILVAATPKGVCAVEFGDSAHELLAKLQARFPKARFEAGDLQFKHWVSQVLAYVERPSGVLDLPLDIQGTVFQRQVWQALREIAPGQTRSYTQVAEQIGKPQAVRAVASACANNTLAVVIPCHRVVRQSGDLAGYRWGLERKAELLKRERGQE